MFPDHSAKQHYPRFPIKRNSPVLLPQAPHPPVHGPRAAGPSIPCPLLRRSSGQPQALREWSYRAWSFQSGRQDAQSTPVLCSSSVQPGVVLPPVDTWQHLEIMLVVTSGRSATASSGQKLQRLPNIVQGQDGPLPTQQ